MKITSLKCPECNGILNVDKNLQQCYCTYCGAKIVLQDEYHHTKTYIDQARIKEAEVEQIRVEHEYSEKEERRKAKLLILKIKVVATALLIIIGSILVFLGFNLGEKTGDSDSSLYLLSFIGYFMFLGALLIWINKISPSKNKKNDKDDDDID